MTHRLFGNAVVVGGSFPVAPGDRVGVVGHHGLHLLLVGDLLEGEDAVLAHLDPLRHVADRGVLWKVRRIRFSPSQ